MHEEFSLSQLLADPLIRQVMDSDAVEETDIRRLAERISLRNYANRPAAFPRAYPQGCDLH